MSTDDVLVRLAESCTIRVPRGFTPASRRFGTPEGLQLHYLDWPGQGDTIVFLHGGALTAHTWDLVALELENDFHCVALDLRGHGLSDWSERYSIPDSVRDVAALADQLGGDGFHVVGMSLGGNVAAHYAASPALARARGRRPGGRFRRDAGHARVHEPADRRALAGRAGRRRLRGEHERRTPRQDPVPLHPHDPAPARWLARLARRSAPAARLRPHPPEARGAAGAGEVHAAAGAHRARRAQPRADR